MKTKTCSKCGGSGKLNHCGRCNGSGSVSCSSCSGTGEVKTDCPVCIGGWIRKTRLKNCPNCHGTGWMNSNSNLNCDRCRGSGQVEDEYKDVCPNCNGVGYTSSRECKDCNGTGKVTCPDCHGTNRHQPSTCNRCDGTGKVKAFDWDDESESSSLSSSSSEGGPIQAILGLLILIAICWGGYRGYRWLFHGGNRVDVAEVLMKSWQAHLEQRCEAFEDGLSENEIVAKGLKNYTWDEWQALKKGTVKAEGTSEPGVTLVTKKAKEISDTAKSAWQNLTSKKEEDSESELKRLNARLAELEGEQKSEGQQYTAAPKVELTKQTADRVNHVAKVQTSNTVTSASKNSKGITLTAQGKGKTKEDALQDAIRRAVWKTVGIWVDSKERMTENRDGVTSLLRTVTEADVGKYEIVETRQQDGGFVVKAKVAVSKRKIAPKFTKVFPDVFTTK